MRDTTGWLDGAKGARRWALALVALIAGCDESGTDAPGGQAEGAGGQGGAEAQDGAGAGGDPSAIGGTAASGGQGGEAEGGAGGEAPRTFLESYPLAASFPEGGTYDPVDHAFFVGSLLDGSVHRVDASTGADAQFFAPPEPGAWWTLGMAVDEPARRLWVCAMEDLSDTDADPAYDGYVWLFDLETGEREAVFPLSDAYSEATCTDVAVAADGTVYVTDRDFGHVYTVDASTGPELLVADAELEASLIGQNAAVVLPDQSALMVAIYLPSRLVRVDLADGSVLDVDISGSFADAAFLAGADGMTYHDGSLYVAFTSELVRVDPVLGDWSSVTATEVDVPEGMTDVLSTPNGLYLLNGQAVRYALDQDPDPFALTRFVGAL